MARIWLSGDKQLAQTFIGYSYQRLAQLKEQMKLLGLKNSTATFPIGSAEPISTVDGGNIKERGYVTVSSQQYLGDKLPLDNLQIYYPVPIKKMEELTKGYLLIFLASMCNSIGILKLTSDKKKEEYRISPIKIPVKYDPFADTYSFAGSEIEYVSSYSTMLTAQSDPSYSRHKIGVPPSEEDAVFGCFTVYYQPDITNYGLIIVYYLEGVMLPTLLQVGFPDCYVPIINYPQDGGGFKEGFAFTQTTPRSLIYWKSVAPHHPALPLTDEILAWGRKHYEMKDKLLSEVNLGVFKRTPIIEGFYGDNEYYMLSWRGEKWEANKLEIKDDINQYSWKRLVIDIPQTTNVVQIPGPFDQGTFSYMAVFFDQSYNLSNKYEYDIQKSPVNIMATINDNVIFLRFKKDYELDEASSSYPGVRRTIVGVQAIHWIMPTPEGSETTQRTTTIKDFSEFLLYKQHTYTKSEQHLIVNDVTIANFGIVENTNNDLLNMSADDSSYEQETIFASRPPWEYLGVQYGDTVFDETWDWPGYSEYEGKKGIILESLTTTKGTSFVSVMDYDFLVGQNTYILMYQYDIIEKYLYEKRMVFPIVPFLYGGHGYGDATITIEEKIVNESTRKRVLCYCIDNKKVLVDIPYNDITGLAFHANNYNFLYTYLVPIANNRKRIIGVINISDKNLPIGYRQEWEITDDNNKDFFGKTFPNFPYKTLSAIGLNRGTQTNKT